MILQMRDFKTLDKPWLEEFHINKYVKPYDARSEGRYLNPPSYQKLNVGDRVFVAPRSRYKFWVSDNYLGKYGIVEEIMDGNEHRHFGRKTRVRLITTGEEIFYREIAFRRPKLLTSTKSMTSDI